MEVIFADDAGPPALAFDIDGVFKAGKHWFPDGLRALARARAAGCPVAFLTNGGGGMNEADYLRDLKKKIIAGAEETGEERARLAGHLDGIGVESMILSYTPMGEDPSFRDKRILLIGDPKEKVKAVARGYGWTNATHVDDYGLLFKTADPFGSSSGEPSGGKKSHSAASSDEHPPSGPLMSRRPSVLAAAEDDFDTVVVMTDPHDWFSALQIAVDVAVSAAPNSEHVMEFDTGRDVKVHFSNPDIFWKAEHPQPRFGQGAFRLAFETLLRARLSLLKAPPALVDFILRDCVVQWGKPSRPTLSCVQTQLDAARAGSSTAGDSPSKKKKRVAGPSPGACSKACAYWMVGDNPASDMALSAMGKADGWKGCLVKTGVYADGDATCGASAVAETVSGAVELILGASPGGTEAAFLAAEEAALTVAEADAKRTRALSDCS